MIFLFFPYLSPHTCGEIGKKLKTNWVKIYLYYLFDIKKGKGTPLTLRFLEALRFAPFEEGYLPQGAGTEKGICPGGQIPVQWEPRPCNGPGSHSLYLVLYGTKYIKKGKALRLRSV